MLTNHIVSVSDCLTSHDFQVVSLLGYVPSRLCPFQVVSLLGCVLLGCVPSRLCPFQVMSLLGCVPSVLCPSRLCPFQVVSLLGCVFPGCVLAPTRVNTLFRCLCGRNWSPQRKPHNKASLQLQVQLVQTNCRSSSTSAEENPGKDDLSFLASRRSIKREVLQASPSGRGK